MKEAEKQTLAQAIHLIKKGKNEQASNILIPLLRKSPDIGMAWAIFFQATNSLKYKHKALQEVLRIRPDDQWATTQLTTLPPLTPSKPTLPPIPKPVSPTLAPQSNVTLNPASRQLPSSQPLRSKLDSLSFPPANPISAPPNNLPANPPPEPSKSNPPAPERPQSRPHQPTNTSQIDWNPDTIFKPKAKPKKIPKWVWGVAGLFMVLLLGIGSYFTWQLVTNPTKAMEIEAITTTQTITNLMSEANYQQLAPLSCAEWEGDSMLPNFEKLATEFGYKIQRSEPLSLSFSVAEISRKEATVYISGFFPEMGEVNPAGTGIFTLQREDDEWKWCGAQTGFANSP